MWDLTSNRHAKRGNDAIPLRRDVHPLDPITAESGRLRDLGRDPGLLRNANLSEDHLARHPTTQHPRQRSHRRRLRRLRRQRQLRHLVRYNLAVAVGEVGGYV